MGVAERHLTKMAAESEYTTEQLSTAAAELEQAIQSRLHKHFKRARLHSGEDYWVLEWASRDGVWLAFTVPGLLEEARAAGVDLNPTQVRLVGTAHLNSFQEHGETLRVPGPLARRLKDPMYYPIYVNYPDGWNEGMYHTFQRFEEYVWRYELSPAEALDYWAVEWMNTTPEKWAGKRNVQAEAIRKNVRQAKEKLGDDELGAAHERTRIRAVSTDEIPADGPHDPETDVFYVPTEDLPRQDNLDDQAETS